MRVPRIIGITGLAGSGKDTLADHIAKNYGHMKYSLATPIKVLLNKCFGWTMEMWDDRQWKEQPAISGVFVHDRLMGLQDPLLSPRQLAQWLGTEVGREIGGPGVWIDLMIAKWYSRTVPGMIVPDIRFDNEAEAIHNMGGKVVQIIRPGIPATEGAHSSAKGVRSALIDATITNDRSVDDFLSEAVSVLQTLRRR